MCNQVANLSLSFSLSVSLLNPFVVIIIMAKKSLPAVTAQLSTPPPGKKCGNRGAACLLLPPLLPNMHTLCECLNELFLLLPFFWLLFKLGSVYLSLSPCLLHLPKFLAFSIPVSKIKWKVVSRANFRSSSPSPLPLPLPACRHIVDTYFRSKSYMQTPAFPLPFRS